MDKAVVHEEKKIEGEVEGVINQDRVFNFSDGVFAFAATLLIVKIDLPIIVRQNLDTTFLSAFSMLWPQYFANIVTFLVIGYYWLNHHAIFSKVKKFDAKLVWINIVFLISVSFLPFPVDLYGDFPDSRTAVVFYSASLAVVGFLLSFIWLYAVSGHRLVSKELSSKRVKYYSLRSLVAPIVFTLSIPLVYVHPAIAQASWLFVIVGTLLVNHAFHFKSISQIEKESV